MPGKLTVSSRYKKQNKFLLKMLGYTKKNNDVLIFFENEELSRLVAEKIIGSYVNVLYPGWKIGNLEAVIDEDLCKSRMNLILTKVQRNPAGEVESMSVSMMRRVYDAVNQRGKYELHEGFRHVTLLKATCLDYDIGIYEQLQQYVTSHSKLKVPEVQQVKKTVC